MQRKFFSALFLLVILGGAFTACENEKIVEKEVFLLYRDIYGVVEYEPDGDYPPPANLDNYSDDLITVTLYFGENIDIFYENEVYGYFITTDNNDVNYQFPFVPSGWYWLNAEFTILDSCFQARTEKFFHSDSVDTVRELRPTFLGLNKGCFSVGLSGVAEGDAVKVSEGCWVTRKVYERFYRNRQPASGITAP